jgi:hypothetical protein
VRRGAYFVCTNLREAAQEVHSCDWRKIENDRTVAALNSESLHPQHHEGLLFFFLFWLSPGEMETAKVGAQ